MYIPGHFNEEGIDQMVALISEFPLATIVGRERGGAFCANHIPLVLGAGSDRKAKQSLVGDVLQGHVPRSNMSWLDSAFALECLAIFQGDEAYISPNWYASKPVDGKVVPTWNYSAVHCSGEVRVIDDALWVRAQIERLTVQQEQRSRLPWSVSDAPEDYIERLMAALVGIEITITTVQAKRKLSQNQSVENRAGVATGLSSTGRTSDRQLAEQITRFR